MHQTVQLAATAAPVTLHGAPNDAVVAPFFQELMGRDAGLISLVLAVIAIIGFGLTLFDRMAARDIDWIFLESGDKNLRAHRFFERAGFPPLSHVFTMRLSAQNGA